MVSLARQIWRTTRALSAPALALWFSGALCLFCCTALAHGAEASCESEAEAVESASHACCAEEPTVEERCAPVDDTLDGVTMHLPADIPSTCCPISDRYLLRAPVSDSTPLPAPAPHARRAYVAAESAWSAPIRAGRRYIPDRSDTHLRCNVLLI